MARLEDEFDATKSVDCHTVGPYYLRHQIRKAHKDLAALLGLDAGSEEEVAPHRDARDAVKNVIGRLFGSKSFRGIVDGCIQSLKVVGGLEGSRKTLIKKTSNDVKKEGTESCAATQQAIDSSAIPDEDRKLKAIKKATASAKEAKLNGTSVEDPFAIFEQEEDNEADGSSESEDSPEPVPVPASLPKSTSSTSAFLPSLQSGYLPAVDSDSNDEQELNGLFKTKKQRKNKRGQRARRKIFEAKYGNKANHIVKEREQAQKDYEARVARRAAKEAERTGANAIAIAKAEKNRKERRKLELRPIHASWQLAKQQKEKLRQAKPEGSKIVFD